jgi:hypothetical protein
MTTAFPGADDPHAREQIAPERVPDSPDMKLFAHIEGLVGEEEALLEIPAKQRSRQQEHRLREIGAALDPLFEKLRERAQRLGRPHVRHA